MLWRVHDRQGHQTVTLLLREVGRFILESLLWIGVLAAVTGAMVGPAIALGQASRPTRIMGTALVGAAVVASLAHRLDLPLAWAPQIGGRTLPIVWAAAGAMAVVITMIARRNKTLTAA